MHSIKDGRNGMLLDEADARTTMGTEVELKEAWNDYRKKKSMWLNKVNIKG